MSEFTKSYQAKKGTLIYVLLIGFILIPIFFYIIDPEALIEKPFILLPLLSPFLLMLWVYFDTSYKIQGGFLHYRSAFLRGKIEILRIRHITKGKTTYVGIKPAMALKGMVIQYNKYSEIYIAPESNEELINDLLLINPEIKIQE